MSNGQVRTTIQVRIHGARPRGARRGRRRHARRRRPARRRCPRSLPLAGEWTLESFCDHLATVEQWQEPPEWELARLWRNWAFESAALDLALRQAGRPLHEVLGLESRPLTLRQLARPRRPAVDRDDPPPDSRYPDVHFKLDAAAAWTLAICEDLAATRAVDVVDFKGQYGMEIEDPEALAAMYEHVIATFPDAILEDPHDLPDVHAALAPHPTASPTTR